MNDILIVGDVYLGQKEVMDLAEKKEINTLFGDLLPLISKSKYSIANLESPVTTGGSTIDKTGSFLKTSPKSFEVIKSVGFKLLTLANNHIMDFGEEGLESTFAECENLGLDYVGAGKSIEEARTPHVIHMANQKICIINIAENEFSTIGTRPYGANPMDLVDNNYDISKAKNICDKVIVIVHGGREQYNLPSPNFRKTLRFYANSGADAVVAHHTHCVSGYEIYRGIPIFYGLGNFIFNSLNTKDKPLWNTGLAIKLIVKEEEIAFELFPYYQCKDQTVCVKLIKGDEKEIFLKHLDGLNAIIENDDLLHSNWQNYIDKERKAYKSLFFVKNKWLRKFVNRNLIPLDFFINKEHKTNLINLIRCETHREILLDSLKKIMHGGNSL